MTTLTRRSALALGAAAVAAPFVATLPARAADPDWFPVDAWTQVLSTQPIASYWKHLRDAARVGKEFGSTDAVWRSFFRVPVASLAGTTIRSVAFEILLTHSPTPNPTPVQLFHVQDIDPEVPLAWNTQPGWIAYLGTASGASYGSQLDQVLTFGGLQPLVEEALAREATHLSFGLRAGNERDQYQWKKFTGDRAGLTVTRV
ncbi:hypothetical protein GCM10029976_063020 [Kribbella albertanoniae]|uniref:Uncharacterized protein n=1 Tax=Kribbella albertanoniae TaxID=1266829 RepID=A0A4R4PIQ7_9ACTN|nr:hypothetical protein [Kribbella albertanoniae]TDC21784.1 hypothetical protein E1261_32470 [Kribbella albertanoniae]